MLSRFTVRRVKTMDGYMSEEIANIGDYRKLQSHARHLYSTDPLVKAILNAATLDNYAKLHILAEYLMSSHIDKPPMPFTFRKLRDQIVYLWQKDNTPKWDYSEKGDA